MVAPTRFGGPRERRFVGPAGTAKPKASEKEVPLEDGPAESGENSAGLLRRPSWTRSSRRLRPTRQRPRRRPPHRDANTPGPCPLIPRSFATASRREALKIRSELQPGASHRRFLWSTSWACRVANKPGPCPLRPRAASLTTPVLSLFAREPSLGAPHHSEQARSSEDSLGAAACSFTSEVLVERSVGSIAACVNPRQ